MSDCFLSVQPYTLNAISDDEDDASEGACGDARGRSTAASKFYGVLWTSCCEGHSKMIRFESFKKLVALINEPTVASRGVTDCPVHRFFPGEAPHKLKCDVLHVLYLGVDLAKYEKTGLKCYQKLLTRTLIRSAKTKGQVAKECAENP